MPISRPLLIALVAAVVAAAAFFATQGSREAADAPVEMTETPTSSPAETGAPAKAPRNAREAAPARSAPNASKPSGSRARAADGVVPAVRRAMADRKLVILFFYKPGAADDRATARGVAALRSPSVAVFTDPVDRLAKYRKLIGQLGISQAPAVVIIGKDRTARVIEGYIDPATLAQDVADAR